MNVLVTGASGFIAGYLVAELLGHGHAVVGLDDDSKYGPVPRAFDRRPAYRHVSGDAKDVGLLTSLIDGCDHFVAGAAIIGGIGLFHARAYDLIAENERLTAAAFDAAISAHRAGHLRKITVVSSSMVYERATVFPTPEGHQAECPPPRSTYGFQKLSTEYFAAGAWAQHGLPYTIARPFNCVGIGERRARGVAAAASGNPRPGMGHVVPDLVKKVLLGEDPLRVLGDGGQVRCYTHGGDLARGLRLAIERPEATNEDFNLSTATPTTVRELAGAIWRKIRGDEPRLALDAPYPHDVPRRVPDVSKARRLLGFEATTTLDEALDEVIPWVRERLEAGEI